MSEREKSRMASMFSVRETVSVVTSFTEMVKTR